MITTKAIFIYALKSKQFKIKNLTISTKIDISLTFLKKRNRYLKFTFGHEVGHSKGDKAKTAL